MKFLPLCLAGTAHAVINTTRVGATRTCYHKQIPYMYIKKIYILSLCRMNVITVCQPPFFIITVTRLLRFYSCKNVKYRLNLALSFHMYLINYEYKAIPRSQT